MAAGEHFEVTRRDDGLAVVTMLKATMAPAFFGALGDTFRGLADDDALRAVVLRGSERCFSYGLDLRATFAELGPLFVGKGLAEPRSRLLALIRRWQADLDAVATLPVPVVGAVHGWCIGGGLDLAAACDVRLCSADAKLSLREAKVAIVADLGSLQRLPAIIGAGKTRELAYTAKDVMADEALRIGLVNDVFADREALDAAALAMAGEIAANPPLTVRGIKQVLAYGEGKTVADGLEYVAAWNAAFMQSEDLAEAASAFMSRRSPEFKGR